MLRRNEAEMPVMKCSASGARNQAQKALLLAA